MRLSLRVLVSGHDVSVGYQDEIPEPFQRAFEPIQTSDDPMLSYMAGDTPSKDVVTIMKTRDDAVDILSKEIAKMLVMEMKKNDTHNGYKRNDN